MAGTIKQLSPGRFLDVSKPIRVRISAAVDSRPALLQTNSAAERVRRFLDGRWVWVLRDEMQIDVQMTPQGIDLQVLEKGDELWAEAAA